MNNKTEEIPGPLGNINGLSKSEKEETKKKETKKKVRDAFDEAVDILEEYDKGTPQRSSKSNDWGE